MSICLSDPVSVLHGIGPAKEKALNRLGVYTVEDLLFHVPRGYEDRGNIRRLSEAADGASASFLLTVGTEPKTARVRGGMHITKCRAFDESGMVEVVFFNQDYVRSALRVGQCYRFTGRLSLQKRTYQLLSPKFELYDENVPLPALYPVYRLCEGLNAKAVSHAAETAIRDALPFLHDYLPEDIRRRLSFPTLQSAIRHLHMPTDREEIKAALRRLSFDELFLFSLGMALSKSHTSGARAPVYPIPSLSPFLSKFPFALTEAQKRVCNEIAADLRRNTPMSRILVGDVGCGKTVCAAYAAYTVVSGGGQVALMAPTEILARQHYDDLSPIFESLGFKTALLLGSTPQREKRRIYEELAATEGKIDLVIGTHALLSEHVSFSALGLTITDEQHRFGVMQRAALRARVPEAHLLVMSATPIPRTLALVLYGDLDMSRIDEMPKGRRRVETYVVNESYRNRIYDFISRQVSEGGQVYVVCPAIEPSDDIQPDLSLEKEAGMKSVKETYEALKAALPSLSVGLLHGKMRPSEKETVMDNFVRGDISVLVSTTVIEVGVNVPRASLMVIEDADRFGLAQLHQLRGRVGRGSRPSHCILISNAQGETARQRLDTMRTTYDGYLVAEEDLKLRGPGDFLSAVGSEAVRQSGGLAFRFASLCEDTDLLSAASEESRTILSLDTEALNEYKEAQAPLFSEVERRFRHNENLLS